MGNNYLNIKQEKKSSTLSKQKEIFEELANRRMKEIPNLSKQTDFNNVAYRYNGNNDPKTFIDFKDPLGFYKTLEKAEDQKKNKKN